MAKKYLGFRPLTSNVHFYTAALDKTPVLIFCGNELIGAGTIDKVTEHTVEIKGERYIRANCTFVYAD
ncbi:hypothetical protein PACILC2_22630 [Paenibacillus cisolokensis]|uniref:Uncharacterized protein n=1 Tax=Paenibacillus cisolokensis TaxID=1658519 RepID=A0ABQ4N6A5_9BACL|nr:hypothetical protein PACILC2_22630 [Paenibacillus cisolokensis]